MDGLDSYHLGVPKHAKVMVLNLKEA